MERRVVISGMGVLTGLGRGLKLSQQALATNSSALAPITSFDASGYSVNLGGEVKDADLDFDFFCNNKKYLDRASYLALTAARDAFVSAKLNEKDKDKLIKADVVLGTTLGGMRTGEIFHRVVNKLPTTSLAPQAMADYLGCSQTKHIMDCFNINGEALGVNNACASSLAAIGVGFERILSGQSDLIVVGGYDVMAEFTYAGFNSLQLLASAGCRPFDLNRSGLILGEGAGILVLEEYTRACRRGAEIFAEVIGYGQTSDAYHMTKPEPSAKGAAAAISLALAQAQINPEAIDYINAHGTGTASNDAMEAQAVHLALETAAMKVPISSTKPFTGHLLGAAGAVETIFSALTLNSGILPPNLNYQTFDPQCNLNIVKTQGIQIDVGAVLSTSFGFGGANAAIVLKKI